jgi:TPR repeat protein
MTENDMERELELTSGIAAFEAKHFVKAYQLLEPLAAQGDPEAQFRLAIMCQNGLGMVTNPDRAVFNMRAAARQGHALAQHGLGFMYLEGECVEKDPAEAARWFRTAADQGLAGSLTTLAMMYEEGNGVPQDREEARRLYEQAGFNPAEFR